MADTHIKIKPVTPRVQYTGNGSTTVFPYSFPIFDESEMVVYEGDDVITTGYTVSGAGQTDGGNVTFGTAPADGTKITLLRNVSIERMTDFQEGGTFRPKNINDELDRQTAFMQQVQEKVDRTLILPPTSDVDPSQILGEVVRIYDSIDNIDSVADDLTNVDAVAGDLTNIDAVAGDLTNIDGVAADLANIDAVNANKTNINAVAGNATNINAVAGNKTNINTVSGIASDVSTVASNASAVSNVSSNMSDVNDCVTNMAAIQDAPNQAQAAADSAALAFQYANDKINQTHITNCITYVPQDIKLELNNGTLTLKAGSKVYVPNGDGVFDEVAITNDLTISGGISSAKCFLFLTPNNTLQIREVDISESGASSTLTGQYRAWYDTTNNSIKFTDDTGATWTGGYSFPLAVISCSSSSISGIDNIFNGFGYIGSTMFVLPGVKGLIPNGRNADGTLKNDLFTISNVLIDNVTGNWVGELYVKENSVVHSNTTTYNEDLNKLIDTAGYVDLHCKACEFSVSSSSISYFTNKNTFRAIDYSDRGIISGWAMPSKKYIDLTLGASGSSYKAPANGWFCISIKTTATNQVINLINDTTSIRSAVRNPTANDDIYIFIPAQKNDTVKSYYTNSIGALNFFRFIYSEGEV